jgi:hypothetical protein
MKLKSNLKKSSRMVAIVMALAMITGSCNKEENPEPAKGQMSIAFAAVQGPSNGRIAEETRPASVIVSVVDRDNNAHQYVRLALIAFGEGYVSENLELPVGDYRLTDFFVMDDTNHLIYSTPKEGSPLAPFVNDPLDITFGIRNNNTTLVSPQVIAVEDAAQPGDFGYASFGFDLVPVTAFLLPETTENIVKVSYEFNDRYMYRSHKGEVTPTNSLINLNNPALLNNIWRVDIIVWTEPKDCITDYSYSPYQKVYRFRSELTFTGAVFQLPDFTSERWAPYYYRTSRGIGVFFSANPLKDYHVELHVPDDIEANYCWLDRRYWSTSGGETCNLGDDAYAHLDMDGTSVGMFRMADQPGCETHELKVIDSFVAVNSDHGAFHEFFSWTIVDGVAVPSCSVPSSSSGRMATPAERQKPSSR